MPDPTAPRPNFESESQRWSGPQAEALPVCPRPFQCLYCPGLRGCFGHRAIGSDSESRTLVIVGPGRQCRGRDGLVLAATCCGPRPGPPDQSLSHYVQSLAPRLWGVPAQAATAGPEPESQLCCSAGSRPGSGHGQGRAGRAQQKSRLPGRQGPAKSSGHWHPGFDRGPPF